MLTLERKKDFFTEFIKYKCLEKIQIKNNIDDKLKSKGISA